MKTASLATSLLVVVVAASCSNSGHGVQLRGGQESTLLEATQNAWKTQVAPNAWSKPLQQGTPNAWGTPSGAKTEETSPEKPANAWGAAQPSKPPVHTAANPWGTPTSGQTGSTEIKWPTTPAPTAPKPPSQSLQGAVKDAMQESTHNGYLPWCSKSFKNTLEEGESSNYYVQELFFVPQFCQNARIRGKVVTDGYDKCGDSLYRNEGKIKVIHGLWPSWRYKKVQQDVNGQKCMQYSPQSCTGAEAFDINKLKNSAIFKELDLDWDAIHTHDAQFWKYEWDKHGTCSGLGLVEYFSEALRAYDAIPSLRNLFMPAMQSGGTISVEESQIRSILGSGKVSIKCHYTNENGRKKYWFDKLQVCFSRNSDGSVGERTNCGGKLSTCHGPIFIDGIQ